LRVGVYSHKLNASLAGFDHAVDGVAACTTDANNFDYR
jgi:hypothetical protein